MIFKILLSGSMQTPNSDKNWQTACPLQTFVFNISRHLEFIIEQGHRVNWVSGSLDSRVSGSLDHKVWWGVGMFICLERGADCLHMVQLMPLHPQTPSSLASFKSRLILPFWYQLTQVVLEKRPLNGYSNSSCTVFAFGWEMRIVCAKARCKSGVYG